MVLWLRLHASTAGGADLLLVSELGVCTDIRGKCQGLCRSLDSVGPWVPWAEKRSNQSILKEINSEYSLERLMLNLQDFGYLMRRANSLEKTLMLGKIEVRRRKGRQRMWWLDSITDSMEMNLSKKHFIVKDRGAWRAVVHGIAESQTRLSDWTTTRTRVGQLFKK